MIMHEIYLPFTEEQLLSHFAEVRQSNQCQKNPGHIKYYKNRIERYAKYNNQEQCPPSLEHTRRPCQIEKDERFWTASTLMTIFHSKHQQEELNALCCKAFGRTPPVKAEIPTWKEFFGETPLLIFEAGLPAPKAYKAWLRQNLSMQQFIPYILKSAGENKALEGRTNVDALIINPQNGCAIIIEAKVLSDIQHDITYDSRRNQIARNIDVMLEKNDDLCPPLNTRCPENTVFLLLTPKAFKDNPSSRLYGYKFNEYKQQPNTLSKDLSHRKNLNWKNVSDRLGWLTWEDFKKVNNQCCPWLETLE